MSSSGIKNKDFSDGMHDGEQLAKWGVLRWLKANKKKYPKTSEAQMVISQLEDYIGKPFNLIACVAPDDRISNPTETGVKGLL